MTRTLSLAALAAFLAAPAANAQVTAPERTAPRPAAPGAVRPRPVAPGATGTRPAAPGAFAPGNTGARGATGKAAVSDALFAAAAAGGGLAEVTLAQLGAQKATDPELKRFSQQMIQEHTRMNDELMRMAAQKRIGLPRTVDSRAQFCAQSLAGLSGEEFDKCYAKAQLLTHMEAVSTFEAESERGMDPDMKALAGKALPHIKGHLKMIKPIAMRYEKEHSTISGSATDRHETQDNAAEKDEKDDKDSK